MNELPTWSLDWRIPALCIVILIAIMLCEIVFFMAVILSVGAVNIMLQMRSGPRAVSQQILTDIPFSYLRHISMLFSSSLLVDAFVVFHLGLPEQDVLSRFPMFYLHRQSLRLWAPVAKRLLYFYTVIAVVNCILLVYDFSFGKET